MVLQVGSSPTREGPGYSTGAGGGITKNDNFLATMSQEVGPHMLNTESHKNVSDLVFFFRSDKLSTDLDGMN